MESKRISTTYGDCRCCSAKGYHRDIMKEYFYNGIREVYFDAFLECFNLFLSTHGNLSKLICTQCIQRLRDACSFKTMVVSMEQQLLGAIDDKDLVFVNVPVSDHIEESNIKREDEAVKDEPAGQIDSDGAGDSDYLPDDENDDSEMQAHPTSGQSGLVEGEAELVGRFPPSSLYLPTRRTLYRACGRYVRQLDVMRGKAVFPSMIKKMLEKQEKRNIYTSKSVFITEKIAHIVNASTLLECSNITPFKSKIRTGFPCFYCRNIFENITKLRDHQMQDHSKTEAKKILSTLGAECLVVYVEVSNLKCTLCEENIPNLKELKTHLIKVHNKKLHLEYTDRVIPFNLSGNNGFECQMCGYKFETFGSIERHMNVHYRNYVCKDCGSGFVTKYRLKVHSKSMHVDGDFPCEVCKKVFTTHQKYKNHVDTVHKLVKRFKCPQCPERFTEYFRRQKHMVQVHDVAPLQYKCNVCERAFDRRYTLSRHMKREHLEERDYQCDLCAYKCFTNNELRVHMVKHNGERIFECSVCKKSYARKKTLKEHMRIHNNDRRFSCAVCGQAFVQKCSLKGHIKTHHLDYNNII